jgi:hypothetical protein
METLGNVSIILANSIWRVKSFSLQNPKDNVRLDESWRCATSGLPYLS